MVAATGYQVPVANTRSQRPVKAISGIIRGFAEFQDLNSVENLHSTNAAPRDGDLILVKCRSDRGFCTTILNDHGVTIKLYEGDLFVGVLASRHCAAQGRAGIPNGPVTRGDVLQYTDGSGMVGVTIPVCGWLSSGYAMPLEVIGFPKNRRGRIANVADGAPIDIEVWRGAMNTANLLVVAGTSSGCGKTTLASQFGRAIKRVAPEKATAGIKATGVGGMGDKRAFLDAGFDVAVDFCDAGLASTHAVREDRFLPVFESMINFCRQQADVLVVEFGGDFLGQSVPSALRRLSMHRTPFALSVNHYMDACDAMRRLDELDLPLMMIGSHRQSLPSIADRVGHPEALVVNATDHLAMDQAARRFLGVQHGSWRDC